MIKNIDYLNCRYIGIGLDSSLPIENQINKMQDYLYKLMSCYVPHSMLLNNDGTVVHEETHYPMHVLELMDLVRKLIYDEAVQRHKESQKQIKDSE